MTLLTPEEQRWAAVGARVATRLKQLRSVASMYQAPPEMPSIDRPAASIAVAFAIRELEAIASLMGIETEAGP